MLQVEVHEIRGECPVYEVGKRIVIDDPFIDLDRTDALCTHALAAILHYSTTLQKVWCPLELGLTSADDVDNAYIQCVDPGKPYTEGGTVIFRLSLI